MTDDKFNSFAQELAELLSKYNVKLVATDDKIETNGIQISVESMGNEEPVLLSDWNTLSVNDLIDTHGVDIVLP